MEDVPEPRVPDEVKHQIIDMYRAGKKTREITEVTGVVRSSIYYILDTEGVTKNRKRDPRSRPEIEPIKVSDADYMTFLDRLLAKVIEQQEEIGRLKEQLRQAERRRP